MTETQFAKGINIKGGKNTIKIAENLKNYLTNRERCDIILL